jgi:hypothetical protein
MSLTVACVLSKIPGKHSTYDRSHVDRLERMVRAHMRQPFQFVCVDDSPFPGWWAKISLFDPNLFKGRVFYLDLDTTVIGPLDDLADAPAPFAIIENFKEIRENNKAIFNSSVMTWDASYAYHLFTEFTPSVMYRLPGDQDWISERIPEAHMFPNNWCVSYKVRRHLNFKSLPKDARIVCYHGKPKPWELPDDDLNRFTTI